MSSAPAGPPPSSFHRCMRRARRACPASCTAPGRPLDLCTPDPKARKCTTARRRLRLVSCVRSLLFSPPFFHPPWPAKPTTRSSGNPSSGSGCIADFRRITFIYLFIVYFGTGWLQCRALADGTIRASTAAALLMHSAVFGAECLSAVWRPFDLCTPNFFLWSQQRDT